MNGIGVKVKNGNLEKAIRRFRRKVKDSNLMIDWKSHQHFISPSKRRRDEKHKSKRRMEERDKLEFAWDKNSKFYQPR